MKCECKYKSIGLGIYSLTLLILSVSNYLIRVMQNKLTLALDIPVFILVILGALYLFYEGYGYIKNKRLEAGLFKIGEGAIAIAFLVPFYTIYFINMYNLEHGLLIVENGIAPMIIIGVIEFVASLSKGELNIKNDKRLASALLALGVLFSVLTLVLGAIFGGFPYSYMFGGNQIPAVVCGALALVFILAATLFSDGEFFNYLFKVTATLFTISLLMAILGVIIVKTGNAHIGSYLYYFTNMLLIGGLMLVGGALGLYSLYKKKRVE